MGEVKSGKVHINTAAPARSDGYRPISNQLWTISRILVPNSVEAYRYMLSASRRLDVAHKQFERARKALNAASQTTTGSPLWRTTILGAISECELGVIAMYRAFEMASSVNTKFSARIPFPKEVSRKLKTIKAIREAFEHIDERAFGKLKKQGNIIDPLSIFDFTTIVKERRITYGPYSLSIDDEATELFIKVRDYLVNSWTAICSPLSPQLSQYKTTA